MLRGGASRKVGGGLSRGGRISDPWECVCVDLWEQRHGPSPLGQVPMPALCDSMAGALRALLRAPPGRVGGGSPGARAWLQWVQNGRETLPPFVGSSRPAAA